MNHELVVWSADNNLCILFCKIKEKRVPVKLDSFQIFFKSGVIIYFKCSDLIDLL